METEELETATEAIPLQDHSAINPTLDPRASTTMCDKIEEMPSVEVIAECETSQNTANRQCSIRETYESSLKDIKAMDQQLREAVRQRDCQAVKTLLAAGASLSHRDHTGMTPLHLCIHQYCYWHFQHKIPRKHCLQTEMKIIQAILRAAEQAENNNDILNGFDKHGRSALYLAIECGYFEVIQALIRIGANMENVSDKKETALHVAVQRPDILEYFLVHHKIGNAVDTRGYAAIHAAAKFDELDSLKLLKTKFGVQQLYNPTFDGSTALHVAAEHGSTKVAGILIRNNEKSVSLRDNSGETALNRSAKHGQKAFTALLLNNGAVLSDKGHNGKTAVEQIARKFPDPLKFFEDVFDECITENDSTAICKERKVHVDYKVFTNSDHTSMSQIKVIEEFVRCGQSELLLHPLIESLLYLKWRCLLPVFYTIIAIYAFFLVSFNAYMVSTFYRRDYYVNNCSNSSHESNTQCHEYFDVYDWTWIVLIYLSIFLLIGQECVYMYLQRRRYFEHFESWLKLCLLALAAVVLPGVTYEEPGAWLRHVSCAALLLSWIQAMFFLSRFPDWGYYVLMFERVAFNIFKILLTSVCLVIGFSFCFMIQYRSESPFDGPEAAFVKTLVMMSSEFDYEDLFADDHSALDHSRSLVRLLFVIFVIFIAIVLMNFMIGIAVSDINELKKIGNIRRLEKQVELQSTLDVLVDTILLKLFKRLSRIKFHHNISKDIETDEKWKVWHGVNSFDVDEYEQFVTTDLQNGIVNVAKRKAQRKNDDDKRNEKKKKLDVIYDTLTKLAPFLDPNRQAGDSNVMEEITVNKTKISSLEISNVDTKQSINLLKENVNKLLAIMSSVDAMTPDKKRSNQDKL